MKVLVIGGRGGLGALVCRELGARKHEAIAVGRRDAWTEMTADAIVNCAGASVAMGFGHGWRGYRAVDVPIGMAAIELAKRTRARLVYVAVHHGPEQRSTAYVDAHERVAGAMGDIEGVVVRATGFFSAYTALLPMAKRGLLADIGDGRARTNPIAERDLAEILVDVTVGGDGAREVAAGGPEVMSRREIFEHVAALANRRVRIVGMPVWLARAMALAMRPFHPRMSQFTSFACGLARHDVIAPALGTTKLADYLKVTVTEGSGA